jgi:hypothetical protein
MQKVESLRNTDALLADISVTSSGRMLDNLRDSPLLP